VIKDSAFFDSCLSTAALQSLRDVRIAEGRSMVSGAVYFAGEEHLEVLKEAYCLFAHTNPLHADVFPSVRRMEAEVVAMTASLLGGGRAA
jgi:sphinganine-1-phosphate aldolase